MKMLIKQTTLLAVTAVLSGAAVAHGIPDHVHVMFDGLATRAASCWPVVLAMMVLSIGLLVVRWRAKA